MRFLYFSLLGVFPLELRDSDTNRCLDNLVFKIVLILNIS